MSVSMAELREILDRRRSAEDCGCPRCRARVDGADVYECRICRYRGRPASLNCACHDSLCPGGDMCGTGCSHGVFVCPVCDDCDGTVDAWLIVREIREKVREESP
jgi:hypothetical protein